MHCNSSPCAHSAPVSPAFPNEHGGVLNALLNYWFRCIELADSGDTAVPEWNLAESAVEPMEACFMKRGIGLVPAFADGFTLGLRAAKAVMDAPLNCEWRLRHILDDKISEMKGAL